MNEGIIVICSIAISGACSIIGYKLGKDAARKEYKRQIRIIELDIARLQRRTNIIDSIIDELQEDTGSIRS